jgi:hypothetical protein
MNHNRSSDDTFIYDLRTAHAVEDYVSKQLKKLGYCVSGDHKLIRETRPVDSTHSAQSDNGDLILWSESTDTFFCDIKANAELLSFYYEPDPEDCFNELLESNYSHLWLAQDTSISKILCSDIDIAHWKFLMVAPQKMGVGPDGDPVVESHPHWALQVDGSTFDTWDVKRRTLSEGRTRSWYRVPVNTDLSFIDLTIDRLNRRTDHNPTTGFNYLERMAVDINSYRQ